MCVIIVALVSLSFGVDGLSGLAQLLTDLVVAWLRVEAEHRLQDTFLFIRPFGPTLLRCPAGAVDGLARCNLIRARVVSLTALGIVRWDRVEKLTLIRGEKLETFTRWQKLLIVIRMSCLLLWL